MSDGVRVTVTDLETGEEAQSRVIVNDYFIVCAGSCEITSIQNYPTKGTQVLTIKGVRGA